MQVSKTYAGTVSLGTTVKRLVSYGVSSTASVYSSKVDTVNSIIAQFLAEECGVDARYQSGAESGDSFLWIYNVPFLFNIAGTNSYASFYGPLSGAALNSGTDVSPTYNKGLSKLFDGESGTYSFGLVFAGNPDNGFSLRFKTYNTSSISRYFIIRFMKCVNLINSLQSVVWSAENIFSSGDDTTASDLLGGMRGIDLNADGSIKTDSFSNNPLVYRPLLDTNRVHKTSNAGALPLVPLNIGPYRANGIYLRPCFFGLPNSASSTAEIQAEVTISGRSFLITNTDGISNGSINMGLIETT